MGKKADDHVITSKCACGKSVLKVNLSNRKGGKERSLHAVDCHCPKCRKYHASAFASYLEVPESQVTLEDPSSLRSYRETCDEVGDVERLFCRHCYSKMATRVLQDDSIMLVNMGSLVDATIPRSLNKEWAKNRTPWQLSSKTTWQDARPQYQRRRTGPPIPTTTGSCSCGRCRYEMAFPPQELQHCYCRLCRQLSGSAFQTWIPIDNEYIRWLEGSNAEQKKQLGGVMFERSSNRNATVEAATNAAVTSSTITKDEEVYEMQEPPLIRTTEHGRRHICTHCGGVLTIVYDEDPFFTWPAAGSIDDASLPEKPSLHCSRVVHICCKWKQPWYSLPKDDLERIDYAS